MEHFHEPPGKTVTCRRATSEHDLSEAFAIRLKVFVDEQGVPDHLERDSDDSGALHMMAYVDGVAAGTARLVATMKGQGKIGRVAVLKEYRGIGLGKLIMEALHREAALQGIETIALDAQVMVIPFYRALGYREQGREFIDCGILHRTMTLAIENK
ncbi:MAG: GNAT family N-acetyltransferase [Candidatus Eremiobacteraeota bacterium]|nr:GNAT family N-acetyltransferase [Candidatus Eremiobacteraeota bacterium]